MRAFLFLSSALLTLACAGIGDTSAAHEGDDPGECTDGADNDRNGAFDCDDPACTGAPACKAAANPAAVTPVAVAPAAKPAAKLGGKQKGKVASGSGGRADCASACRHLVTCAEAPELQADCVTECTAAGHDAEFLAWFNQQDCPTTLTVVAMLSAGDGGGGSGGRSQSSQCQGCVWDGTSCSWYSQSDWGSQNAYSGAVISCDASCCGR